MVKIYFDTCSLHRPLDNKSQLRITLEAEAVLGVLAMCEDGRLTLVSSEVLSLEVDRNPQPQKRAYVSECGTHFVNPRERCLLAALRPGRDGLTIAHRFNGGWSVWTR